MKRVEPPDRTMLEYRVFLRSKSDFRIELASTSCIPSDSSPTMSGLNKSSGALYREEPSLFCFKIFQIFFKYFSTQIHSQNKCSYLYDSINNIFEEKSFLRNHFFREESFHLKEINLYLIKFILNKLK